MAASGGSQAPALGSEASWPGGPGVTWGHSPGPCCQPGRLGSAMDPSYLPALKCDLVVFPSRFSHSPTSPCHLCWSRSPELPFAGEGLLTPPLAPGPLPASGAPRPPPVGALGKLVCHGLLLRAPLPLLCAPAHASLSSVPGALARGSPGSCPTVGSASSERSPRARVLLPHPPRGDSKSSVAWWCRWTK